MTTDGGARQALVDMLNAERYGPSLWWTTKPPRETARDWDWQTYLKAVHVAAEEQEQEQGEVA